MNFIIIYLCDNDFGNQLEQTAKLLHEHFCDQELLCSELRVKDIAVDLIVALCNLSAAARGFAEDSDHLRLYLTKALDVVFTSQPPTEDHDGGSVAIDRNTGYIWRF